MPDERKVLTYEGRMELRRKRSELLLIGLSRRKCARIGCSNTFQKKNKNHSYCSPKCAGVSGEEAT